VTLALAVAGADAARAATAIQEAFLGELEPAARACAEATLDLDAEEKVCPACSARFTGLPSRCPTCGLRIG
jgi:predicted Zn-ribbon and HTH transcriptional regulator